MLIRYIPKLMFKKGSMPLYVTFFVTNRCNLKCNHCFYSAELNKPINELTLEEIKNMAKTMGTFPIMLYSGGEPFLRKDLAEITHLFYKYNKIRYLSIPTNGSFLKSTELITEKICQLCPKLKIVLTFSVDGLEEEHNKIRGDPNAFKNAMKTFHHLKKLKRRYKNLKLGFVPTFTASNQDNIDQLYDYLKKQGPDSISINLIRGTPKNPLLKNIDIHKFKKITARVQKDLSDVSLPGYDSFLASLANYRYNMILKTYEENKFQTNCYASLISCVIYPGGDVYPCELLDSSKKIGNLRDFNMDFRELWRSKKNHEVAKWVIKTKCFCTHECNIGCNTTFNPKHFLKIVLKAGGLKIKSYFKKKPNVNPAP